MRLNTLLLLLLISISSFAQDITSPAYKQEVKGLWQDVARKEREFYGKQLLVVRQSFPYKINAKKYKYGNGQFFEHYLESISQKFPDKVYKKVVIKGMEAANPADSLAFDKAEQQVIVAYLKNTKPFIWTADLLGNVNFVNSATIDSYYNYTKVKAGEFLPEYPHEYFQLSKALFLKDHSVCIFYWGYNGGSASHGKINMYKKGKNGWELFSTLYSWEE